MCGRPQSESLFPFLFLLFSPRTGQVTADGLTLLPSFATLLEPGHPTQLIGNRCSADLFATQNALCLSFARSCWHMPNASARRAMGNHPDAMGMPMLKRAARSQLPFQNCNCPFTKAKAASHVHIGPFECPNILNKCVLFAAQIAC